MGTATVGPTGVSIFTAPSMEAGHSRVQQSDQTRAKQDTERYSRV